MECALSGAVDFTQENVRMAICKLEKATANDYAEFLGDLTTGALFGYGAGRVVVMAEEGAIAISKEITFLRDAHKVRQSLGNNPFRGKSFKQIDAMLRNDGFTTVGKDPVSGIGAYFNPKTGRKYYLDGGDV